MMLLWVASLYLTLWFVTQFFGVSQVRHIATNAMHVPKSSTDISAEAGLCGVPFDSKAQMPYHWCAARAYAPFLLVARYGVIRGGFDGEGGSTIYVWLFGYTVELPYLGFWPI
jgi:hypothetical protein